MQKIALALVLAAAQAQAQAQSEYSQMEVTLVTLGPSQFLYTAAGHSILRVKYQDKDQKRDLTYNWGIFKYTPEFVAEFFQGNIRYRMGTYEYDSYLAMVKKHEPRQVVEETLHLTDKQKEKLYEHLLFWEKPSNNTYSYHIWQDNCSTKIRDIFDDILNHQVKKHTQGIPGTESYRELWAKYFGGYAEATMATDVLLNQEADVVPDLYEQMYIPERLRQALTTMPMIDDRGEVLPGTRLLGPQTTLVAFDPPREVTYSGYIWWWIMALPLAASLLLWLRKKPPPPWLVRLAGVGFLAYGLVAGLLGVLILITPWISNRTYFYTPASMWLLWPVDFAYCVLGTRLLLGRSHNEGGLKGAPQPPGQKALSYLAFAHTAAGGVFLLLGLTGFFDQSVANLATYLLLPVLLTAAATAFAPLPAATVSQAAPQPRKRPRRPRRPKHRAA